MMGKNKLMATSLYDFKSFVTDADNIRNIADGQNGAYIKESLISVSKTIHEYVPPSATFLSIGFKVDNSGGYANVIKSMRVEVEGGFKQIGTSTNQNGTISLSGSSTSINVFGYDASSSYSVTELNQAKAENRNLPAELHRGHQSKYMEKVDELGYRNLLDTTNGFGLASSGITWVNMTQAELEEAIRNLILWQRNDVVEQYYCDVVVMPKGMKLKCQVTNDTQTSALTIEQKMKRDFGVKFVGTVRAEGADANGKDIAVAVSTDQNAMQMRIPKPLGTTPTWRTGNDFNFKSGFRIAGLDILEVNAGYFLDTLS